MTKIIILIKLIKNVAWTSSNMGDQMVKQCLMKHWTLLHSDNSLARDELQYMSVKEEEHED